jgi:hypothetical protein
METWESLLAQAIAAIYVSALTFTLKKKNQSDKG